jgi:hypothetical protein
VRSESSRNGIAPGPTTLVSVPSRGAPHHPRSSLRGVGRARRRGLSARRTSTLRHPSPHGSRVPPLGGLVPCRSGVTPGTAASSGGGLHRETKSRDHPLRVRRWIHQTRVATSTMGSTCVSGEAVHSRALTRQVTHSVPNQIGRLPEEFLWLVLTSRARAHTSYPGGPGQGCRTVCWRVLMGSPPEQGS